MVVRALEEIKKRHVTARVLRAPWVWAGRASAQGAQVEAGVTEPGTWRSGQRCAGGGDSRCTALRGREREAQCGCTAESEV